MSGALQTGGAARTESIPVYCPDEHLFTRVRKALPERASFQRCRNWAELYHAALARGAGIVVKQRLTDLDDARWLTRRAGDAPLRVPCILATNLDGARQMRLIASVVIDEVLTLEEIETHLPDAWLRARARAPFEALARAIESCDTLPMFLREGLSFACRSPTPVATCAEFVVLVDQSSSTVLRQWHGTPLGKLGVRLEDVLDWLRARRCIEAKSTDTSWSRAARSQRTTRRWLHDAWHRLTGEDLKKTEPKQVPVFPPPWAAALAITITE